MITDEKTHKKPTENTSKEMEIHLKNNRNITRHQVTVAVVEKGGRATIWRGHMPLRGINAPIRRGHSWASEIHVQVRAGHALARGD